LGTASFLGPLCAFFSACTWTTGISVYSRLSRKFPAYVINFNRALVALPLFIGAAFFSASSFHLGAERFSNVNALELGWFSISIISSYAFGDALFFWSTRSLGVSGALAISSTYPLWSALAGWWFRGEVLGFWRIVGLFIVVVGTAAVILSGIKQSPSEKNSVPTKKYWLGVVMAFGASLLWSLNTFAIAQGGQNIDPAVGNTFRMCLALILCPVFGLFIIPVQKSERSVLFLPKKDFKRALWVFIVEGFAGSYFFLYGLTHAPLGIASALSGLSPVLSVPLALLMKWEDFSFLRTAGVVTVMIGVWLILF